MVIATSWTKGKGGESAGQRGIQKMPISGPLHAIPVLLQVPEPLGEDKKKGKPEKSKRCIRTAAGSSWEDPSLLEWDAGKWGGAGQGQGPALDRIPQSWLATTTWPLIMRKLVGLLKVEEQIFPPNSL